MFIYDTFAPKSTLKNALAGKKFRLRDEEELEISQESSERAFPVSRSFRCGRKLIEPN